MVLAYLSGATTRELAVRFGVWRTTIGRYLKARDIDTKPPALQPDEVDEATKLYRAGWTLEKIARRYGVGNNTVRSHLMTMGVRMRARGRQSLR